MTCLVNVVNNIKIRSELIFVLKNCTECLRALNVSSQLSSFVPFLNAYFSLMGIVGKILQNCLQAVGRIHPLTGCQPIVGHSMWLFLDCSNPFLLFFFFYLARDILIY